MMLETPEKIAIRTPHKRRRGAAIGFIAAMLAMNLTAACSSPEQRVEKYSKSGQEYLEKGNLGTANVEFQNALKINEEHVPSLIGLAQIAEEKQDYKGMFSLLQRVNRLDPQNLDALVKLGKLYLISSDETAALEHADKALAISPDDVGALGLKAAVQLKLGDRAGAVELAQRVIEIEPANPEAVTVIATERTLAGDQEGALAELDRALTINPEVAILQLLRIRVLTMLERPDDVLTAYADLITLFPDEPAYRRVYTNELINRKDYASAQEQLEAIVDLTPESLDAKLDVIRITLKINDSKTAEAKLRAYVEANPENFDLKFALVDFLQQAGDKEGVNAILQSLSQSGDQDVALSAKNKIAARLLLDDQRDQAMALIDEILKADDRNTEALVKRAGLQIADEEYDSAIVDLRAALDNSPDSSEAMVLMASAFERQGNISVAGAELAKAVEASESNAKVSRIFAKFLVRHEDKERAEEVLVKSLAAHPGDLENLKLLAAIRLSLQNWRGAEEIAEIIDSLGPEETTANYIRSAVYTGLQEYDRVIEALSQQNDQTPLASRPLSTLVAAYLKNNQAEEAEALLIRILASDSENYSARMLLAQVYGAQDKNSEVESALIDATAADPTRPVAYELLYRYYLRDGQTEKAAQLIDEGIAVAPENDALRVFKADALIGEGRLEEALELYSALIEARPNDKIIANNFVSLSSDLRNDPDSIARALEASRILEGEDNPYFKDTVGWANYRAGDFAKATELLSQAADAASGNAEILYHLGAAYFAAGDLEKAKATLNGALGAGGADFRYIDEVKELLGRI